MNASHITRLIENAIEPARTVEGQFRWKGTNMLAPSEETDDGAAAYRAEVDAALIDKCGLGWEEAGIDEETIDNAFLSGESAIDFVDAYAEKYDLFVN